MLVVYGPNLNLLGEREPHIYGHDTMEAINARLSDLANREGAKVEFFQSNSEGAIIDRLQQSRKKVDAVVLNAGALSHYSYALRDAIAAIAIPVIEIHMTNVVARGEFRMHLVLAPACKGVIYGFGVNSFLLGLRAAIDLVRSREQGPGTRDQKVAQPIGAAQRDGGPEIQPRPGLSTSAKVPVPARAKPPAQAKRARATRRRRR